MGDEYNEAFGVEEVKPEVKEIEPFTLEDALEDETNKEVCIYCSHVEKCPIIIYVDKLSMKRDGKTAECDWGCTMFKAPEEQTEEV